MTVKVYAYGCARPSREIRDAINDQLHIAYRYRYALWQLALAGRATYRELRRKHVPELAEIESLLEETAARFRDTDKKKEPEEFKELKRDVQILQKRARELREKAKTHEGLARDIDTVNERTKILGKALRNVFSRTYGLYSGTYLHVERAARRANAGTEDPVRPFWDGSGALAIALQDGRSVTDVTNGSDPSIHVLVPNRSNLGRRAGARTTIRYRLRSDKQGRAVFIDLPVMYSRPLPADSKITSVKLSVKKIHEYRYHYEVQFTTTTDLGVEQPSGAGVVAVCLKDDEVWIGDEYTEPTKQIVGINLSKGNDLLSIRDNMRNEAIRYLIAWCETQDHCADWVRKEIEEIEARRSCRKLFHLRNRLRGLVDNQTMTALDTWAYRENHLYWWQSDMRRNALNNRKNAYRNLARSLARKYRTLVIDSRSLNDRSRLTEDNRWLGLHELRTIFICAFCENVHTLKGDSCEELLTQFRDLQKSSAVL